MADFVGRYQSPDKSSPSLSSSSDSLPPTQNTHEIKKEKSEMFCKLALHPPPPPPLPPSLPFLFS